MSSQSTTSARLPTYYLSHGGGPWPWMQDRTGNTFTALAASLKRLRHEWGDRPKAILVVTAHWETPVFTFSTAAAPGMVYDYYNFPPETYRISYPAPGLPALGERGAQLLRDGGMAAATDDARGFDHGTFSLMKAIYPDADIPVVQMSIRQDYDPAIHLAAGRLLAPLRDEGVAIVGSGLSYHNLRNMGPTARAPSAAFDGWLQQALAAPEAMREAMLLGWDSAPAARLVHPREDHLIPLHVAVGAAMGDGTRMIYHEDDFMGGIAASSFQFGALPA